jgi:polar amino acid transport system permease protein
MHLLGADVLLQPENLERLLLGLWVTVRIALISVAISMVLGTLLGVIRCGKNLFINAVARLYLEAVRIVPTIVWLFVFYFGVAQAFSLDWSAETTSIIVFAIWGTAEMSDLVRASIQSLPPHQRQSAQALGLSEPQIYFYVILPQAVRSLTPAAINLVTRMIKTTPLVALITVVEALKVGQEIIEVTLLTNPMASFWIYGFIFFLYFIICYPVSLFSRKLEARWKN